MKEIIFAFMHLMVPCIIFSMEVPPPRRIIVPIQKAWQEHSKEVPSLFALAAKVALKQALFDLSYKKKLLSVVNDIQEKTVENMPDFFQELLETTLASRPEHHLKMKPTFARPFTMSPLGQYVCVKVPKNISTIDEMEIIDFYHKERIHCPKDILSTLYLGDQTVTLVNRVFNRTLSWLPSIQKIAQACTELKASKLLINNRRSVLLIVAAQLVMYYDVKTDTFMNTLRNIFLHQTSPDCSKILFTDLAHAGRTGVVYMPSANTCIFPHEQALHPTINPDGLYIAAHNNRTIFIWNSETRKPMHQIIMPHVIKNIHFNQTGSLNVKCKLPDNTIQYAILSAESGKFITMEDTELHDVRALEVNEEHSLAYYQTAHGQEKLWSFALNKPIRIYYPKLIVEKAKIDPLDPMQNYCLVPTHKIFKGRSLKELISLVLNKK